MLADLADGLVNLGRLLPVLLFLELARLELFPVLLPGLGCLLFDLHLVDVSSLAEPLDVRLHVSGGLVGVR